MTFYEIIILLSWLIFLFYWAFSALSVKRSKHIHIGRWLGTRAILILIILVLVRLNIFDFRNLGYIGGLNPLAAFIGTVACVCGIAFALWARYHLGRNWGMPMSEKENPELVTTGPYAYVRHPIYTGIILAMFGSALAMNAGYFTISILATGYFIYSARKEEQRMLTQFPIRYREYMGKTHMIIPFLL